MNFEAIPQMIYYILLIYALGLFLSIGGTSVALYLALAMALIYFFKKPLPRPVENKTLLMAVCLFLGALLVTTGLSLDPMFSLKRVSAIATRFVPMVLTVLFINDRRKLNTAVGMLILSVLLSDGYAFWQHSLGVDRVFALANHPVVLGALLIEALPLLIVIALEDREQSPVRRGGLLAIAALSTVVLVMTGTRGAWIGLLAALVLYVILTINRNRKTALTLVLVLLVTCAAFAAVPVLKERFDSSFDMQYLSNSERLVMWKSAWHMFLDHPVAGVGLGLWPEMDRRQYMPPEAQEPASHMHAHSNYFNFLGETGLTGFLAFIGLFGYILYLLYRRYRSNPHDYWSLAALLTTVAFSVQGFTEYNFGHLLVLRLYTFILGLSLVGSRLINSGR